MCVCVYCTCREYMVVETRWADMQVTISIIILVLVLVISPIIIFLVRHATFSIQVGKLL